MLAAGFLRNDFSLTYVAEHSNRSLSGLYKLSAFWGGQEGSLLLWLLILTATRRSPSGSTATARAISSSG